MKVSHDSKKCPSDLARQEKLGHWSQAEFLEPVLFLGGEGLISAATPRVKDVPKGNIWKETEVEDRQCQPRYQSKGLREKQKGQAQCDVRSIQNQAQIREFRDFFGGPAISTKNKNKNRSRM